MTEVHELAKAEGLHLGRIEPTYEKTKVRLNEYLDAAAALPSYPGHSPSYGSGITFPMYGNDAHGDCTCAAIGHLEQVYSKVAGGSLIEHCHFCRIRSVQ